jgi:hypothetical protein
VTELDVRFNSLIATRMPGISPSVAADGALGAAGAAAGAGVGAEDAAGFDAGAGAAGCAAPSLVPHPMIIVERRNNAAVKTGRSNLNMKYLLAELLGADSLNARGPEYVAALYSECQAEGPLAIGQDLTGEFVDRISAVLYDCGLSLTGKV